MNNNYYNNSWIKGVKLELDESILLKQQFDVNSSTDNKN